LAGEPTRQLAEPLIGRPRQVREEGHRVVGILLHRLVDRRLVEFTEVRREFLETGIPAEVTARCGLAACCVDLVVGLVALLDGR
jgi:hypothetical protein